MLNKIVTNATKCLMVVMLLCLTGCNNTATQNIDDGSTHQSINHRIIIDTDTGGDDAAAIMMALKADNITVEGITALSGNVPLKQAAANALMCVEISGQDVPVYYGSDTNYLGEEKSYYSVFGEDGMGDLGLIHPTKEVEKQSGVDFILETIKANPNEIDLVCLGPVTDIALAIDKDSETMSLAKSVIVMGTAGFGSGNATPVAEFNVYDDAEAFERLLEADIPVTVIGLDMCGNDNVVFNAEQIDEWKNSTAIKEFLANSWNKLYDFYVGNGLDYISICDAVAMYTLIYDDAITSSVNCAGICITDQSSPAYGEVIFYKNGFTYDSSPDVDDYQVTVVTGINDENYHARLDTLLN